MEGQIIEVQRDLDESHAKVYNYAHRPPFAFVNNVISLWAIELIYEQVNKPSDYECDCVISHTHGLPCNCRLEGMEGSGIDLRPYHVHGFWRSMEYRKPPEVDKWEDHDAADRTLLEGQIQKVCEKGAPSVRALSRLIRSEFQPETDGLKNRKNPMHPEAGRAKRVSNRISGRYIRVSKKWRPAYRNSEYVPNVMKRDSHLPKWHVKGVCVGLPPLNKRLQ
ncbi:hypothetical protein LINGRAHAP2_LOCUS30825 [Linum grandiflorum]